MLWHHVDLFSHRLLGRELPLPSLLFMDSLGFLGFLAILITNGIIASGYNNSEWRGVRPLPALMIYNSVPWIVCWCVAPFLVFHFTRNQKRIY